MYPMPEFQELDQQSILDFIRKYPLGMLTAANRWGKVFATHVPFLLDAGDQGIKLRAHVMRKTEYWQCLKDNPAVLVAFTGPDAPVLESWMERLPFGGTWNYMSVHVRGQLTFLPQDQLHNILQTLKDTYEVDPATKFENLPPDYIEKLVPAIEGFEIAVQEVQAVFKLSQNRSRSEFDRTIKELRNKGGESALVADEMASRAALFFPNTRKNDVV